MNRNLLCLLVAGIFSLLSATAQGDYPTNQEVEQRLKNISSSGNAKLLSLTKTEGQDVWALQLGTGDIENKPAIAITGGAEGYHLLSVELALQVAERILKNHPELLETTTFYVFPNMSPDAYSQYFSKLKYERRGNAMKIDQDRDGIVSEDGYEDLNGDGLITMVRVESPLGKKVAHENEGRILVDSENEIREGKRYLTFSEGIDNDKDEKYNEDPEEGIAFNKNLTYQFPVFEPYAGDFPVSQKEFIFNPLSDGGALFVL